MAAGLTAVGWLVAAYFDAAFVAPVVLGVAAVAFVAGHRFGWRKGRASGPSGVFWQEQRERARRLSIYAEVPWVFNRWYFDFRLKEEIERCRRYGFNLAVLRLALDAPEPDAELLASRLVECLAGDLRPFDAPARLTDTDYVVCLLQCDREGADAVVNRLDVKREFAARHGVAVFPDDGDSQQVLLDLAERRLDASQSMPILPSVA